MDCGLELEEILFEVLVIPALDDNFMYICVSEGLAVVIDPTCSEIILSVLREKKLKLAAVLITHAHYDHVGGVADLRYKTNCEVIAAQDSSLTQLTRKVKENDIISFANMEFKVIETPGHSQDHLCYFLNSDGINAIFTGDVLFTGGCGRFPIENREQMWNSLIKISKLPDQTLVYCGHDYALENYEFALSLLPYELFRINLEKQKKLQIENMPSVPSTIKNEKETNIFLLSASSQVKQALSMDSAEEVEIFGYLRKLKNNF